MATSPPRSDVGTPIGRVRKRTRVACDKCSSFRVRCDGQLPCRRCQEYGHVCNYARDIKKRGRKPAALKLAPHEDEIVSPPRTNLYPSPVQGDAIPRGYSVLPENGRFDYSPEVSQNETPQHTASHIYGPPSQADDTNPGLSGSFAGSISEPDDEDLPKGPRRHDSGPSFSGTLSPPDPGSLPVHEPKTSVRRISQLINHPLQHQSGNEAVFPATLPPSLGEAPNPAPRCSLKGYEDSSCRYRCLQPLLPLLQGILMPEVACDLLEFYFAEPDCSLFRTASPYVLTHVLRRKSLLHRSCPRKTSPALLITMLWVCVQTADMPALFHPGSRGHVSEELRKLAMSLVHERDRDHWHRASGGRLNKEEHYHPESRSSDKDPVSTDEQAAPRASIDDLLTLILLPITISGGDFKTDCLVWWSKAVRLAQLMGLNLEDGRCEDTHSTCVNMRCDCRPHESTPQSLQTLEAKEERRRVFWLLFSLDRHLALSFNGNLFITDDECQVYSPLPDDSWNSFDQIPIEQLERRVYGPPTLVTGTSFFEYFLPLMTILGDVIQMHRRRCHPRLGRLGDQDAVALVEKQLASLAQSIAELSNYHQLERLDTQIPASLALTPSTTYSEDPLNPLHPPAGFGLAHNVPATRFAHSKPSQLHRTSRLAQAQLVTAYSTFILHVLHVLLHGKWDAVNMLSSSTDPTISDWITSPSFAHCATHAIHASDAVSKILLCDPELSWMPYLFGIYLLHGSFILLLFADRMPQVGDPNESVERACETIIRAHEVCVVTLSTKFQKRFRKVLRSTLYSVREGNSANGRHGCVEGNADDDLPDAAGSRAVPSRDSRLSSGSMDGVETQGHGRQSGGPGWRSVEERKARRRELSLYRWTSGSRGLAL